VGGSTHCSCLALIHLASSPLSCQSLRGPDAAAVCWALATAAAASLGLDTTTVPRDDVWLSWIVCARDAADAIGGAVIACLMRNSEEEKR
jgi:hypothetical protein